MGNITKAIAKEQEYLSCRMKNEEQFHLVDAVKSCGFDTLEEYFNEKLNYQFTNQNFDYEEVPPSEAIAEIFRMMQAQETKVLYVPSNETFVFTGESKKFNQEYCIENSIAIYPLYTGGGTIVSTAGDFSLVICFSKTVGVDVQFILAKLKDIFAKYMDNVSISGNDILLNGDKVCGSVMYNQNGMMCFAAHFSFNDNSDLIENICNVSDSIKTPTVIQGLTVEQFKKELDEWFGFNL